MLQKLLLPVLHQAAPLQRPNCPGCGVSLQQLRQTSLLGCAECYRHFREDLLATIQRMQGTVQHCPSEWDSGSMMDCLPEGGQLAIPSETWAVGADSVPVEEPQPPAFPLAGHPGREELEECLRQAVESERYEDAAKIRDLLREMFGP